MGKLRVMFDLDGVIRDFSSGYRFLWNQNFGYDPGGAADWEHPYKIGAKEGLTREETKKLILDTWGYQIMTISLPYAGAYGVFHEIHAMPEIETVIATAQYSENAKAGTLRWLSDYDIIPDILMFTRYKHTAYADIYIDDKPQNVYDLTELAPIFGHTVVCLRQPWNIEITEVPGGHIIHNLSEYVDIVRRTVENVRDL